MITKHFGKSNYGISRIVTSVVVIVVILAVTGAVFGNVGKVSTSQQERNVSTQSSPSTITVTVTVSGTSSTFSKTASSSISSALVSSSDTSTVSTSSQEISTSTYSASYPVLLISCKDNTSIGCSWFGDIIYYPDRPTISVFGPYVENGNATIQINDTADFLFHVSLGSPGILRVQLIWMNGIVVYDNMTTTKFTTLKYTYSG